MKLKFKNLIINNFLSFGHAEISLEDRGYTLIEGINQNPKDAAKSNGAGKSSIFSALCFALTGETIQGISTNLNNLYTEGDMSVQLDLDVDDKSFTITRSRDARGKADLHIIIDGVDKSGKGVRESEALLEQYISGLSSEIIGEVIIIGQGMPHKFSANTPSNRKEILEKLSHSDFMLEDIKNRVTNRVTYLKEDKEKLVVEKAKEETNKTNIISLIKEKTEELASYENKPDFDVSIKETQSVIEKVRHNIQETEEKLDYSNKTLSNLNNSLLDVVNNKNAELLEEARVFNEYNLNVKTALAEDRARVKSLTKKIEEIHSIKDICPTCGQKIPHVHKPSDEAERKERDLLLEKIEGEEKKDAQQNDAFLKNKKDIEGRYFEKENSLKNQIKDLSKEISDSRRSLDTLKESGTSLKVQLNNLVQNKENFEKNLNSCKNKLEELKNREKKCEDDLVYIIKNTEEDLAHLNVLNKMETLIKRDFRGILLKNVIEFIDSKCKEYSLNIFGTDELSFVLDGNNINISYAKKPLESLSGGEKQKVDLIIQFAIRDMMKEFTGFTSNVLVLDEILDNLDNEGCDAILNFITEKLSDIESIFIISHHADTLNIGNDSTITIIKNERGVSCIV